MKKSLIIILLTTFFCSFASAEKLIVNWAHSYKKGEKWLTGTLKRESGGLAVFNNNILLTQRDGTFRVFTTSGKEKYTKKYPSEFIFEPIVMNDRVMLIESNTIHMLDAQFNEIWSVSGKSPVISVPFESKEGLYAQFYDNSIYLIDPANGNIKANYSYYLENTISYMKMNSPFRYNDKVVFGFSNGLIVSFLYRPDNGSGVEEIVPYYKFKTSKMPSSIEKKEFYDIFSAIPCPSGLLFSNGEGGGLIIEDKVVAREKMRNLVLTKLPDESIIGYGEFGVFLYDKEGVFQSRPVDTNNFVTNFIPAGDYFVLTEDGAGNQKFFNEPDGKIYLFSKDMKTKLQEVLLPRGISGKGIYHNGNLYLFSNKGVLYSIGISK